MFGARENRRDVLGERGFDAEPRELLSRAKNELVFRHEPERSGGGRKVEKLLVERIAAEDALFQKLSARFFNEHFGDGQSPSAPGFENRVHRVELQPEPGTVEHFGQLPHGRAVANGNEPPGVDCRAQFDRTGILPVVEVKQHVRVDDKRRAAGAAEKVVERVSGTRAVGDTGGIGRENRIPGEQSGEVSLARFGKRHRGGR